MRSYSILILSAFLVGLAQSSAEEISYNTDIRPILSDKCFLCHGPDEENNKAGLRLDIPESAFAALKESPGKGIVPGKADESVVWHRIITDNEDELMPPPDSRLSLTDREKSLIKQWIDDGAEYQKHWAFEPLPEKLEIPEVNKKDWPESELDHFVLKGLEEVSLPPSEQASPLRWLRRVSFDLTGLPPTVEELEGFEKEAEADFTAAKKAVVGRLMKSPAYGEHMAMNWLDAARYADSYGYQSDKLNNQWPYRDWVIGAFNKNMPYDQFLREQIAGDLLPNPKREQILATAFNRVHRLNNEGGAIFEEWRVENIADRVHTFGTAVLGLTMECSRCHDHKYDPISMRDYYSLFAFFNSIDENGMYDRTEKVPSPSILLPDAEQEAAHQAAKLDWEKAQVDLAAAETEAKARFKAWLAEGDQTVMSPDVLADIDFNGGKRAGWHFAEADRGKAPPLKSVTVTPGPDNKAIVLDGDKGVLVKNITSFDRWTPFTVRVKMKEEKRKEARSVLAHHCRGTDAGFNGWDLVMEDGFLETRLYRVWPGNAIGIRTKERLPKNVWQELSVTYDGSSRAKGLKIYRDGKELPVTILRDEMQKSANVKVQHGGEFVMGYRWRDRGLADAQVDFLQIYSRALTPAELQGGAPTLAYYLSAVDPEVRAKRAALQAAVQSYVAAEEVMNEVPIMKELPEPRQAHMLARGVYDAERTDKNKVARETFEHFGPEFPKGAPRNRLGLAEWVLDPKHPLTARVFVNRIWARFFSKGLVATPENLGLQGALPSHPELLDWLSRDFINHGWDIQRLCRNIVLSATYGQDSVITPEGMSRDPENNLLGRGPAHRLGGEQIRDLVLSASGLLNRKRGGPPVSPYQPGEDLWTESNTMSPPYKQSVGKALHRRSIYSVWKRTAPLPNMMAFDATTREVCAVERSRTNTPMQALVLLNDIQFVEAARVLAQRSIGKQSDYQGQLKFAFSTLTGRAPDDVETSALSELYEAQRKHYAAHPEEAKKLISQGEAPLVAHNAPTDLAALATVNQAILNLDITIWKR